MGMPTQILTLRPCADGYFRTTWYDDAGEPHSKSFGRNKRQAETRFSRFHADWQRDASIRNPKKSTALTINGAWNQYKVYAEGYYRHRDGTPTGQASNIELAFRPVVQLYPALPAAEFGPKLLKSVRQQMIDDGLCRNVINQRIRQIRQVFRWLAGEEMIPATVWHALQAVQALEAGRSEAEESDPVVPVPEDYIKAVAAAVPGPVRAMIWLQYWSACRPGEACILRPCDLEIAKPVWKWRPYEHKGNWRAIPKVVLLGPQAQEAIQPYVTRDLAAYCFSPLEAQRERWSTCKTHRHQEVSEPRTDRRVGARYDTGSYAKAIRYACKKLGIPEWGPNRLRHNALSRLEAKYGIELARIVAGHTSAETTEVYLERDLRRAVDAVAEAG